jgi:hypothetical protein
LYTFVDIFVPVSIDKSTRHEAKGGLVGIPFTIVGGYEMMSFGIIGHKLAFKAEGSQGKGQNIRPKQILLQHSPGEKNL